MTFDDLAQKFDGWRKNGDGYVANCPKCNGHKGTLTIDTKSGIQCGLGCEVADILTARGLSYLLPEWKDNGKGNGKGNGKKSAALSIVPPVKPPPVAPAEELKKKSPQKRTIDLSIDEMPILNAEAWEAIKEQNDPPVLFTHGSGITRVRYDYHDDSLILDEANVDVMRHELSQMADWEKVTVNKKTGVPKSVATKPPVFLVKDVLASRSIPLPRLNRIVTVPVFAPDGTLLTTPGYNAASGVIYAPMRGYQSLDVPEKIEVAHIEEARGLIEEAICDFPFSCDEAGDSADHDNAIALLLLPFVRDMIAGPTPLHLIEASMEGSGKGLLATSLLFPGFGEIVGSPPPQDEVELKKFITSKIHECAPLVYLDNVNYPLISGELAAALTMTQWSDRILGSSATTKARITSVWLATGNNVTMSREIARRTMRIRLAPQTDKPEERTGFAHDDQVEWITENRARLVWAAHILCRNAIQQKFPKPKSKIIGSYERWSRTLGSILECAGYSHFLGNYRELLEGSNVERQSLSLFAMSWHEWAQRESLDTVTSSQLLPIADGIDGINLKGTTDKAKQTSLGKWLSKKHEVVTEYADDDPDNPIAVYRLKILSLGMGRGKYRGSQTWRIELIETIEK